MSRISLTFFGTAVVYALGGMLLGIFMGASNDHSMAPVHAHINLLGWATLALMGSFYGLAGDKAPAKIAWTNWTLSNVGNLMALPMVALIQSGKPPIMPLLIGGEVLIVGGMLSFGLAILTVARGPSPAAAPSAAAAKAAA